MKNFVYIHIALLIILLGTFGIAQAENVPIIDYAQGLFDGSNYGDAIPIMNYNSNNSTLQIKFDMPNNYSIYNDKPSEFGFIVDRVTQEIILKVHKKYSNLDFVEVLFSYHDNLRFYSLIPLKPNKPKEE
jgi:hypothetical protein